MDNPLIGDYYGDLPHIDDDTRELLRGLGDAVRAGGEGLFFDISAEAAAPYADRLFALPAFLMQDDAPATPAEVAAAFALTGFFLDRHVWATRGIDRPATRDALVEGFSQTAGSPPL